MQHGRVIESPTSFVIETYEPGLTIDFRNPPVTTDLEEIRAAVNLEPWRDQSLERQIANADRLCRDLGVTEKPGDFDESLKLFGESTDLRTSLAMAAGAIAGTPHDAPPTDQIHQLLVHTGVLSRPAHYPVRVYCHDPAAATELEGNGTHFGFVLNGQDLCLECADGRRYPLYDNTYFCVPGAARITGTGRVEVLTSFDYRGALTIGGPVEPWGRLAYIDGCTDTILVPPTRLGDPCFNALYFPERTQQTQHVHPSMRAGIVMGGGGICKTPTGDHVLRPGKIFFLPPETWHAFWTDSAAPGVPSALTVIAFHPDSDFGPTDEDHPMLNRTFFRFLHRLRSVQRVNANA
ncbi:AraC family ligand binding domain-containing protein [Sulfidibacter corallicola]|uniref:AraC family ligand binding domain-containing protein n=1 Tax=Sulfidibacter corallicola TaxID=2818388 RepID=A0A8A4TP08_SULCO|nr:AraC family ligand binding domain-containing protein [Sulfidibacter corallicola]QTD51709.1 AraC family ligand binding domain-containing protein [Sulfidibacter corallicola]